MVRIDADAKILSLTFREPPIKRAKSRFADNPAIVSGCDYAKPKTICLVFVNFIIRVKIDDKKDENIS